MNRLDEVLCLLQLIFLGMLIGYELAEFNAPEPKFVPQSLNCQEGKNEPFPKFEYKNGEWERVK